MRILFRNMGEANFFLKTSKKTLADNLIAPDGGDFLPSACATRSARAGGIDPTTNSSSSWARGARVEIPPRHRMAYTWRSLKDSRSP